MSWSDGLVPSFVLLSVWPKLTSTLYVLLVTSQVTYINYKRIQNENVHVCVEKVLNFSLHALGKDLCNELKVQHLHCFRDPIHLLTHW